MQRRRGAAPPIKRPRAKSISQAAECGVAKAHIELAHPFGVLHARVRGAVGLAAAVAAKT